MVAASSQSPQKSSHKSHENSQASKSAKSCNELNLPQAIITKMIKDSLESHRSVTNEAKIVINKCTSIFILFITTKASEENAKLNKKNISSDDILKALRDNNFSDFAPICKKFLEDFNAEKQIRLNQKMAKEKEAKAATESNSVIEISD